MHNFVYEAKKSPMLVGIAVIRRVEGWYYCGYESVATEKGKRIKATISGSTTKPDVVRKGSD